MPKCKDPSKGRSKLQPKHQVQNYSQNTKYKSGRQRRNLHALDQPTLALLIDQQLQRPVRDGDGGIKSLNRSGWAGALFRLKLLSHGYTFVGKGTCTVKPLIPALHIEADMYKRMDTIQGKAIPVYLGNIDLKSLFTESPSLISSWAGEEAWQCGIEYHRLHLEQLRTHYEVRSGRPRCSTGGPEVFQTSSGNLSSTALF